MKKKLNKKKIAVLILINLIIILSIVSYVLYNNNSNFRTLFDTYIFNKNITENTLPKISIHTSNSFAYNNMIVTLDSNTLNFYNKSSNCLKTLDINISQPLFESNGQFLCVAENGGSKLYLIANKNISWQKDIDGTINSIFVNKNGYVAVVIQNTVYKNICKVFDLSGTELFTTYLSNSYIIDLSISDDNKYLALAEANFSGVAIQSTIKIISIDNAISGNENSICYNYTATMDNFIINIKYIDNNLVCIFDNHVDIIKDNTFTEIANFQSSNIIFADINDSIILIKKNISGLFSAEYELQIIDATTFETKTYLLKNEPKSMQVYGNIIAINFGTEIIFINNQGWLVKDYVATQEIQSITFSNNLAGIIFKDKLEFLNL